MKNASSRHPERKPSGIMVKPVDMQQLTDEISLKIKTAHPKFTNVYIPYSIGVVSTPAGYFILNTEGIMNADTVTKEKPYDVNVHCTEEENAIAMFPTFAFHISDNDIENDLKFTADVPLEDFIRKFGSRLESNYNIIKNELQQYIG